MSVGGLALPQFSPGWYQPEEGGGWEFHFLYIALV